MDDPTGDGGTDGIDGTDGTDGTDAGDDADREDVTDRRSGDRPGDEPTVDRLHAQLAAEFEAVAAALRAGDAVVYGYDVATDPAPPHRTGAVSYPDGWLEFRIEER
jgi:hypothetical protein